MKSQKEEVLDYIQENGSISSWEAYSELGITQLGARIDQLKKEGYFFETEWIQKKNRKGKNVNFKKYRLCKEERNC